MSAPAAALPTDPLLLNFDGHGATSTLAALTPGSAWLALDRNDNRRIGNGGELFGPRSGDGFS